MFYTKRIIRVLTSLKQFKNHLVLSALKYHLKHYANLYNVIFKHENVKKKKLHYKEKNKLKKCVYINIINLLQIKINKCLQKKMRKFLCKLYINNVNIYSIVLILFILKLVASFYLCIHKIVVYLNSTFILVCIVLLR